MRFQWLVVRLAAIDKDELCELVFDAWPPGTDADEEQRSTVTGIPGDACSEPLYLVYILSMVIIEVCS